MVVFNRTLAALGAVTLIALGLPASPAAAIASYDLAPQHEGGFGQHGLWIGPDSWMFENSKYFNFEWEDVELAFVDNGDATVSGTMTRFYDARRYSSMDIDWGVEIELRDIEFTGVVFDGVTHAYDGMVEDLMASADNGVGIEWNSLSMELTLPSNLPYSTGIPLTSWTGLAMPNQGHPNVAELHYDSGLGLTFDAWFQNPSSNNAWYEVGDTKARVGSGSSPVPEPTAALVFGIGLLAIRRAAQRRRST